MEFLLREWRMDDAESVSKYADNPQIAANLRDGFPVPYTMEAAISFIQACLSGDPAEKLFRAIDINGEAVGSIGVFKKDNVYRKSAEIGYWLGEPFWGMGIMTEAVRRTCSEAFEKLDIVRIEADPYAYNTGSRRVLENAGFEREGILRQNVMKNGQMHDSCIYALLKPEHEEVRLKDLSNDGLWRLFPVIISEYRPEWAKKYGCEKNVLTYFIGGEKIVRISHIGSTSVPGLAAKPTIDILVEIKVDTDLEKLVSSIRTAGYMYSPQPENPAPHMMFMRGYTARGFAGQAYHVHVRYPGDWDELYFRDYLRIHPDTAKEYGALKKALKRKYEHDRDTYTAEKTEFIRRVTGVARSELGERYIIPE